MKNTLKSLSLGAMIAMSLSLTSAQADVPLFNFTLEVKNVEDAQVFLGKDKKPIQASGPNTFDIKVGKSDYVFLVQYQHDGQTKEAICPISGAPTLVTAIIDPTKTGKEGCITQESKRGEGIAAL